MLRSDNQLPDEDADTTDAENEAADGDGDLGRPVNASNTRPHGGGGHPLSPDRNPQVQLRNESLHTETVYAGGEDADNGKDTEDAENWKQDDDWEGQVELL